MRRRSFIASAVALAALPRGVAAQGAGKQARIGWITAQEEVSVAPFLVALRGGLADLGYVEGRNLTIEARFGDNELARVPALIETLLQMPVDVLVAQGQAVMSVAKLAPKIPTVYAFSGDPVLAGLADSLARPRGNMTGQTLMSVELNGKRLELLREIMPQLRRVAIIANPLHPGENLERANSQEMAARLGIAVENFTTRDDGELNAAFVGMIAQPPDAIVAFPDAFTLQRRRRIIEFGMGQRAPVASAWALYAESGALCTYGPRLTESYRRLAYFIDRILKGAKPADLPIEQPTVVQLVVNLKTAKTLGLTVPPAVLARADTVIE
jgi:putative ABC transport system substrate-binding protein